MDRDRFAKVFPLGSHLCREPMPPMAELKSDMENLRRHGFNLVKLQEHWQVDEPLEGHCDFSRYEELIAHAARLDMGIYLGLTCEQAPTWLWRKHPGCRMVERNGLPLAYEAQATLPCDGQPGPCYDHPGALADMVRFIQRLVGRLGRYENLVIWNTWQEIGYGYGGGSVCYCEHTLKRFRQWLCRKYGDLDGLNRAWNSRFLDWSYVAPDRSNRGRECLPQDVDWSYFMANVQPAHTLQARAQAIRAADPLKRPIFAHKASPRIGAGHDWTYARCQDFLGSSCYPAFASLHHWDDVAATPDGTLERHDALLAEAWAAVALVFDYIRSCNRPGRPVWAAEFQGGPYSWDGVYKGRDPSADDIRRWMLTAVGSGVTAISFWVTRAEIMAAEMDGYGLLDSEGDSTPRFEEASRVGQALNRHADLFGQPSWPGAEVAILVDECGYQFSSSMQEGSEHLPYSVRGWHRLLWEAGIPVDFVEASELGEPAVGHYEALIVPFPLSLSEEVARKLVLYVENGGHLVCEACPGRIDEHAYANRGELSPTMRALFGVRQKSLTLVREPANRRWSPRDRTWGEYLPATMLEGAGPLRGLKARANLYVETFVPVGSDPCLICGQAVAGTVRQAGRGQAWLLGTLLGHNGTAYRDEETRALVRALLKQCGVTPTHQGQLLLRKRAAEGKEAWLFTNPTDQDVTESVGVQGWSEVDDLLGEPLARDGDSVSLTVPSLDVRVLILRTK